MRRLSTLRLGVVGLGPDRTDRRRQGRRSQLRGGGYDVIPPTEPCLPLLSLEELLATSDVVTLHLPLSTETHHLIDASRWLSCADGGAGSTPPEGAWSTRLP